MKEEKIICLVQSLWYNQDACKVDLFAIKMISEVFSKANLHINFVCLLP